MVFALRCGARWRSMKEVKKQFFFEKKNQKTFARCGGTSSGRD